jgi:hypothetical protein
VSAELLFSASSFIQKQFYCRTCARRLYQVCCERGGFWLAWKYDGFEGCDIGKQLGWVDQEAFYDRAMGSSLWVQHQGALGFLRKMLTFDVFRGEYEVHESLTYKKKKWYSFWLKGSTVPRSIPKEHWILCGGEARRLSLTEHSGWMVLVSKGDAPETAPETSRAPLAPQTPREPPLETPREPPPETPRAPLVLPDGENVTYTSDRSSTTSNLQGIKSVVVMVDDLRQKLRKPNVFELHAALEVVNADRGDGQMANLRAGNNKAVAVAVLTTPRGDGDVASRSK